MAKRKRLTKKQKERRNILIYGLLVAVIVFFSGYLAGREDIDFREIQARLDERLSQFELPTFERERTVSEGTSQIHLFDVGQGASTLLIGSDGTSVLIDTGRYDDKEKRIISYLDEHIGLGEKIDLLIFSHNDADHIGHGDLVLEYFDVQEVWMNGMDHTSKVYSNLLDEILASDAEYAEPKAGDYFERGVFYIDVLQPTADSPQKDFNDESIATRIEFDGLSLITSGDASIARENEMVDRNWNLGSDILILGHHGANNSTGENWLKAIRPEMAFYQAGVDNRYGHPHPDTLERLADSNIPVYGTDNLGTISLYVDEAGEVTVETER